MTGVTRILSLIDLGDPKLPTRFFGWSMTSGVDSPRLPQQGRFQSESRDGRPARRGFVLQQPAATEMD